MFALVTWQLRQAQDMQGQAGIPRGQSPNAAGLTDDRERQLQGLCLDVSSRHRSSWAHKLLAVRPSPAHLEAHLRVL
jgi:hypothetical protein